MYRLHSMFGPTVLAHERLTDALEMLFGKRHSNGGVYRLIDERSGREIASIDTYATYWPLCHEENERLFSRAGPGSQS